LLQKGQLLLNAKGTRMKRNYSQRIAFAKKIGLSSKDATTLAGLKTPASVQDFVSAIPINREKDGDSCMTVARAMRANCAHCIEGAFIAATALWIAGRPPLVMDMQAEGDDDHVITLFRDHGCWGAISKSNLVWLRWRDPVYKTLRELAMSYFHEYVNKSKKTLRTYSVSIDLRRFPVENWLTGKDGWDTAWHIDQSRHYRLITPSQAKNLKRRDAFEMKAGKMLQYPMPKKRK
jgi:hypothetical protein